ncbi:TRAP transporter small permease [Photobacterium sp. DNB23_23_1]|uniref:TRAP transporter small permease protein n=1 Tax=Photobacterium pectinilyticum TaxID=2906793 RepID=A0ABT1N6D7_9GAMM|nr:TRAP transporter small permease [Photobacterium sp. ZSDE20]MCQ1059667.1 TRAP transporter small permease [Photobacterium sp. ZSDE20]MDD1825819.1 TRAP transporter small permease [Photobacterium sp. ZSDE20]
MEKWLFWAEKSKIIIDWVVERTCIAIMALLTIIVTYQVVTRYIFDSPSAVSEVLSRYMFVWLVLIGGAYVFGLREHMAISYVRDKLSPKTGVLVDIFTEWAIAIFAYIVMWQGGYKASVRQMWQLDSALEIPMGVIYSALPISGALILVYFIINQLKLIHQFQKLSVKG